MTSLPESQALTKLRLMVETADSHESIQTPASGGNAVLIPEDNRRSIQETLHLLAIPGMRESIRKGLREPLSKASKNPGW